MVGQTVVDCKQMPSAFDRRRRDVCPSWAYSRASEGNWMPAKELEALCQIVERREVVIIKEAHDWSLCLGYPPESSVKQTLPRFPNYPSTNSSLPKNFRCRMLFEVYRCPIGGIVIDQKKFEISSILTSKTLQHQPNAVSTVEGANGDRYRWRIVRFF